MKKCNQCNKVVPEDSVFCQYCGSNVLSQLIQEETKTDDCGSNKLKVLCGECGRELPNDSVFCQYCGSKKIKKNEYKNCNNKTNSFIINKKVFVLAISIVGVLMVFGTAAFVVDKNNTTAVINELIEKNIKLNDVNGRYLQDFNKYHQLIDLSSSDMNEDFFVSNQIVIGTDKVITVYSKYENTNFSFYSTNNNISANWIGGWKYIGNGCYSCQIQINCPLYAMGKIIIQNDKDSRTIPVFVSGS